MMLWRAHRGGHTAHQAYRGSSTKSGWCARQPALHPPNALLHHRLCFSASARRRRLSGPACPGPPRHGRVPPELPVLGRLLRPARVDLQAVARRGHPLAAHAPLADVPRPLQVRGAPACAPPAPAAPCLLRGREAGPLSGGTHPYHHTSASRPRNDPSSPAPTAHDLAAAAAHPPGPRSPAPTSRASRS